MLELYSKGRQLNFSKLYDRVAPEVQSDIVPNKHIQQTLAIFKEIQNLREIKRSVKAPTKRHLGIIPPKAKQEFIASSTTH